MQVQREGYLDKPQIRTIIPDALTLAQRLRQNPALGGVGIVVRAQGFALAKNLQIKVGDELTLLGSALDGSVAATIVPVVGIFESGMRDLDRVLVEMPLRSFQDVFGMGEGAHAIVLLAPDIKQLPL